MGRYPGAVVESRLSLMVLPLPPRAYFLAFALGTFGLFEAAFAVTIEQRVGGYGDNQGLTRQRFGYDLGWDGKARSSETILSRQSIQITLLRDQYTQSSSLVEDDYARRFYGGGSRVMQTVSLGASQTWARTSDTRQVLSFASDGVVTFRSGGMGASYWLFHETVRLGADFLRTTVAQPEYRILDFDSQEIGTPPLVTSSSATFTVRHLATPTTIMDYTVQGLQADNRPPTTSWGIMARQFIPPVNGAFHGGVTRAVNRGALSLATTYGQVDAWILDAAYLQSFGRRTHAKLGYRYYREDETTRVYSDELTIGTDRTVVALSHDLPKDTVENVGVPLTIEGALSRYLTNTQLVARSFEVAVTGRF